MIKNKCYCLCGNSSDKNSKNDENINNQNNISNENSYSNSDIGYNEIRKNTNSNIIKYIVQFPEIFRDIASGPSR